MNERMNEWMNEWMKQFILSVCRHLRSIHTTRVHGPWTRVVCTDVGKHGPWTRVTKMTPVFTEKWRPYSRAVFTTRERVVWIGLYQLPQKLRRLRAAFCELHNPILRILAIKVAEVEVWCILPQIRNIVFSWSSHHMTHHSHHYHSQRPLLPTPTMSVGVGRIFDSVCLSVCPQRNPKTNDPKVFKLGARNDFAIY